MALQGTLETFSVPEVLRLLAGTRKSGLLALEGDRGTGRVWLADGRIVTAESDHEQGETVDAVLFDLLRFDEGSFEFDSSVEAPADASDDGADVEEALVEAEQLLEEWREIESVVPSLDVHVRMVDEIADESITVTAEHWRSLAIIGGGTTARSLGAGHGHGELAASRLVRELVDAGLVEVRTDVPADEPIVEEWSRDGRTPDEGLEGSRMVVDHDLSHDEVASLGENLSDFVARPTDPTDTPVADGPARDDAEDQGAGAGTESETASVTGSEDEAVDPVATLPDGTDADEADSPDAFLTQLATLTPKSAAAADASADEATDASGDGDEEINRNLLLKFLSSAKN